MAKYVLVDWEADHSVSVIPSSKLKYRDGANVVQKWPDGDYRGVILEESDNKKELEKRSKELCKQNSPTKKRKSATTRSPTKKLKTSKMQGKGKKTQKRPEEKLPGTASKKQQRLAEIHRAHKEAEWLFGRESSGEESSGSPDTDEEEIIIPLTPPRKRLQSHSSNSRPTHQHSLPSFNITSSRSPPRPSALGRLTTPARISSSADNPLGRRRYETHQSVSVLTPACISSVHDPPGRRSMSGYETDHSMSAPSRMSPSMHNLPGRRSMSGYETDISQFAENTDSHSPAPSSRMSSPPPLSPMEIRVDKPRMVELVEGLGVYVPAHKLLSAVRASKNSSSALLRQLMGVIFTDEELRTSSVRGRGTGPALDPQKMEAIMGYVLSKFPGERAEYLVRQANDKLAHTQSKTIRNL